MWLLTTRSEKEEGAYAVHNKYGEKVLFMFQQEDDANRYAMMMEDYNGNSMDVIQVDDNVAIMTCKRYNYKYTVVTPNDIVIHPKSE